MPDRNIPVSNSEQRIWRTAPQYYLNGAHRGIELSAAITKQIALNEAQHPLVWESSRDTPATEVMKPIMFLGRETGHRIRISGSYQPNQLRGESKK